jgi:phospholipid/cholesterol/gamma-HCH transport system ATP-binding protein
MVQHSVQLVGVVAMTPTLAAAETSIIEISHVFTRFGGALVHKDVSLTVHRGEVFAIAGGMVW